MASITWLEWTQKVVYPLVKLLFKVLLHIFFHDIEVVGQHRIPKDGACIFVGNHPNQFVDFMILTARSPRRVSFLAAEVSFKRWVVGIFALLTGCIPVKRARDASQQGQGTLRTSPDDPCILLGEGTRFTQQLEEGDTVVPLERSEKDKNKWKISATLNGLVVKILSDEKLQLHPTSPCPGIENAPFKILPKLDQTSVYEKVWDTLGRKRCIGIFPEGSSHDRPELLPLKAGVAIMALGAIAKHDIPIKIIPCGLNYFSGHRFRSHVVVEFGHPLVISKETSRELIRKYQGTKQERREACSELLDDITQRLKNVTLNVPTLDQLQSILLARALYVDSSIRLSPENYILLNRAFAEAAIKFKDHPGVAKFRRELLEYKRQLTAYDLKDYHLESGGTSPHIGNLNFLFRILFRFLRLSFLICLALPGMLPIAPAMLAARIIANRKAEECAENDPHAMYGCRDVMASYKIIIAGIGMPVSYILYSAAIFYFWGFGYALLFFFCLPLISYASLRVIEKGFWEWKMLRVVLTMARSRRKLEYLRKWRAELQFTLRKLVEDLGPRLDKWDQYKTFLIPASDPDESEHLPSEQSEHQQEKEAKQDREANEMTNYNNKNNNNNDFKELDRSILKSINKEKPPLLNLSWKAHSYDKGLTIKKDN